MKKIISILFILCFLNGNYVIAQGNISKSLTILGKPVRVPTVPTLGKSVKVSTVPTLGKPIRVPTVSTLGKSVKVSTVPTASISESASKPSKSIRIDMEDRGFIHEKHLSSPSERPSSTIENNNGLLPSPSNVNIQTIPPKVNMDKLRMKVMKYQNRLNKNEMKADNFIFIGFKINQNEHGEYYFTNYAA